MDPWVQSIVSALVGGVIGGVSVGLTMQLADSPATPSAHAEIAKPDRRENDSALSQRVRTLENELRSIKRHNETAHVLGEYAKAMADAEGDAGTRKIAPSVDAEDPVFELAVRSVYDRLEEERRDERRARRTQHAQERARSQADFVAERLELSPEMRDRFQQLLTEQMEKFHQMRRGDADAGVERPRSRQEWRERVDTIRKETDDKLSEFLTDEQLDTYKKLREEEGFDRRGGRGGPGGPGR